MLYIYIYIYLSTPPGGTRNDTIHSAWSRRNTPFHPTSAHCAWPKCSQELNWNSHPISERNTLYPGHRYNSVIQGNNVVTGSMVVPCVRVLKGELEELSSKYKSTFVNQLKASVRKRLSPYETHDAFLTASALDPRFKLQWCTQTERISCRSDLIMKAVAIAHNDSVTVTALTNDDTTDESPPTKKVFHTFIIQYPPIYVDHLLYYVEILKFNFSTCYTEWHWNITPADTVKWTGLGSF